MDTVISSDTYDILRKEGIFFVKAHESTDTVWNDRYIDVEEHLEWKSLNPKLKIQISDNYEEWDGHKYDLCILDKAEYTWYTDNRGNKQGVNKNEVRVYFHTAAAGEYDIRAVLYNYLMRSRNPDDKYAFTAPLWYLDKFGVHIEDIVKAINSMQSFGTQSIPSIIDILKQIGWVLSENNQRALIKVMESFNESYEVYLPSMVNEALEVCGPSYRRPDLNLFELTDSVTGIQTVPDYHVKPDDTGILQLRKWFDSDAPFGIYNELPAFFSIVSEPVRLQIVKRYFHDIRLGHIRFDYELFSKFRNNPFDLFIRFRRALERPSDAVILTVPLLCDTVMTFYRTRGESFQTYNGLMDFVMFCSDRFSSEVDFRLERFIPVCKGGAVYNDEFKGFIDYQYVVKFDTGRMIDENLKAFIRDTLDKYGIHRLDPVCKNNNDAPLSEEQRQHCTRLYKLHQGEKESGKGATTVPCVGFGWENKWRMQRKYVSVLNTFLKVLLSEPGNNQYEEIDIDWNKISLETFRLFIHAIINKLPKVGDNEVLVPSGLSYYEADIINYFFDKISMRLFPQKRVVAGRVVDMFGYWKEIRDRFDVDRWQTILRNDEQYQKVLKEYIDKESPEIQKRTMESLKRNYEKYWKGDYIEMPYNELELNKILNQYYFRGTIEEKDKQKNKQKNIDNEQSFLLYQTRYHKYTCFCAPRLSEKTIPIIDLPYFWCRGKECLHNNLDQHILKNMTDWQSYSLYHLIEILGYPKLHETPAGYEADPTIIVFIALLNRTERIFKHLQCRACGHLLFTDKSSGYNRYNYYSCLNPVCPEKEKPVYLNYCYHCKKGIIDSRDTRKCPNGWYICQNCLSCCDDALYERQAQRYILLQRPVPERIEIKRGHGHNNHDKYFCPYCGSEVKEVGIKELNKGGEQKIFYCPNCRKNLPDVPDSM